MTRTAINLPLYMILLTVTLGLAGCQSGAPDTNRSAGPIASPTKEPFNPAAIEAEVLKLDKEWANTIKTHDLEAVRRIEADDVQLTYPDGTTGTKADEIRDTEAGNLTADSFEILEAKVTVLSPESAVVTGRSVIKNGKYKRGDGGPIDISGEYRFTDVFAKRNGTWQVVVSQATRIDPEALKAMAKASPTTTPSPKTVASPTASKAP
ncbi:MAG TPA: nuclear transport factor 2 family protein [Pyrinomonadaceae bacterium]|nr:nuclear transport factor 2 family protein [Pyrinomonadaceae bacterium]